ncbi:CobD/CbiB family cobalamin biosynthesis protein [Desulfovibrio sp. SGI.169]|uniref:CobD/CbiB family cobalamin biosynthesis protein n=1 Tax=Desulfovibrio sp. SGI.169 TaxID=3420561 RepID=UPI003CFFBE70
MDLSLAAHLFPYSVWDCWWLAPLALLLDLWLGDPRLPWPHPVCFAGRLLSRLEGPARRGMSHGGPAGEKWRGRLAGLACLLLLVGASGLTARLLLAPPVLGLVAAVYLAWAGLAMGSLLKAGGEVLREVETRPEAQARKAVSRLVSRETGSMDRPQLRKTLADTLSENFTDALLAPLFWLLLAGPVGLWVYKAMSTADSMWGYLTPRWRWLGWAGARGDDCLAFVPARLSVAALRLTDALVRRLRPAARLWDGRWPGLALVARQAAGMPSPNSGWSMTACAWLCRARMAGPSVYFGALTDKPWLGPPEGEAAPWDRARLLALCALMRYSAVCGGLFLWLACLALRMLL